MQCETQFVVSFCPEILKQCKNIAERRCDVCQRYICEDCLFLKCTVCKKKYGCENCLDNITYRCNEHLHIYLDDNSH